MNPIDVNLISEDIYAGPFHQVQRDAGAAFYEDSGFLWTRSFGDPVAEYWAVRRRAAVWDTSALAKYRFRGSDALGVLEKLTTRRLSDCEPGTVRYCLVLNEAGRMLEELTVLVVDDEDVYLLANDPRPPLLNHLRHYCVDRDVRIEDRTTAMPNIAIQGPSSFEVIAKLTDDPRVEALRWFRFIPEPIELAGVPGLLARVGFSGELGYEFYLLDGGVGAADLWKEVVRAGAEPIGLDAIELARLEAGLVIMDEDYFVGATDPYELNMDRFIDLNHDFVGRKACLTTAKSPPRRLVTLHLSGKAGRPGTEVVFGGVPVGHIRSAQITPRFGSIALAVVSAPVAREGTIVSVEGQRATVHGVPIDDPAKERPRSNPRDPMRV
jgi:aminomethyltransferase